MNGGWPGGAGICSSLCHEFESSLVQEFKLFQEFGLFQEFHEIWDFQVLLLLLRDWLQVSCWVVRKSYCIQFVFIFIISISIYFIAL